MMRGELIERLHEAVFARGGRQERGEFRFCCPAHDDEHPSARWHPEKAVWHCDVCGAGGGYVDLARRLGIDDRRAGVRPDIDAFARERHLPVAVLREFGVRALVHQGRPALRYPTLIGVDRIKFTDRRKPKYTWATKGGRRH